LRGGGGGGGGGGGSGGGGCLYSRGFSNYMFNLFSRPPVLPRHAPGIFQRAAGRGRRSRRVSDGRADSTAKIPRRIGETVFSHTPVKGTEDFIKRRRRRMIRFDFCAAQPRLFERRLFDVSSIGGARATADPSSLGTCHVSSP